MSGLEGVSGYSRAVLYLLVSIMGLLTVIVAWAQVGCIRGRPFRNPDWCFRSEAWSGWPT